MQLRTILLTLILSIPFVSRANAVPEGAFDVLPSMAEPMGIPTAPLLPTHPWLDELPQDPAEEAAMRLVGLSKRLNLDVARRAMQASFCAQEHGLTVEKVIVVDMGMKASQKRMWAFDIKDPNKWRLVLNDRVAHGSGSDPDADGKAQRFSNTPNSHMTSLGLYRVAERYEGKHGISRRLDGLFSRFNGKARERAVVLHPSNYVTAERVGRSQGCPAVNPKAMEALEKAGLSKAVLWMDGPDQALAQEVADCSKKKREAVQAMRMQAWEQSLMAYASQHNAMMALDLYLPTVAPSQASTGIALMGDTTFAMGCPRTLGTLYLGCSVGPSVMHVEIASGERA